MLRIAHSITFMLKVSNWIRLIEAIEAILFTASSSVETEKINDRYENNGTPISTRRSTRIHSYVVDFKHEMNRN